MRLEDELYIAGTAEAEAAGTLSAEQSKSLDARLAADPAFAQAYREYFNMLQSLHRGGARASYKAMLGNIHAEVTAPRRSVFSRVLSIPPQYLRTAGLAATVALLTSSLTFWTMNKHHVATNEPVLQDLAKVRNEVAQVKNTQEAMKWQIRQIKESTSIAPGAVAPKSNYSGTGFALSTDGYLLTNYHVVENAENVQVLTRNGKSYSASVVAYEPKTDIALLKIDDEDFRFGKGEVPYGFAPNKAPLGATVYTLGFPQDEIVYNEGYIASRNGFEGDSAQYRLELPAGPGQSGAPVVDATGNVIGIIRSKEQQSEGTTYAVSSRTLLRLLRDLPKETRPHLPTGNHLSGLSRQQQIEKLQDFTCMVQVYKK